MRAYEEVAPKDLSVAKICVLILVDVSGSMSGRLSAVSREINRLIVQLKSHEMAGKMVEIAVMSFSDDTKIIEGWHPISDAVDVSLSSEGGTELSKGVTAGIDYIRKRTHEHKHSGIADRRPQLFLITDGYGDDVSNVARTIKERTQQGKLLFWALGVGDYDTETIAKLTGGVRLYELKDDNSNDYSEFFEKVVAASIIAVSESNRGEKTNWTNPVNDPNSTLQVPAIKDEWLLN